MIGIADYIRKDKKYYIYGTKGLGIYCFNKIAELFGNENIIGFIETEPIANECYHKAVYSVSEIEYLDDDTHIILASPNHYEEMKANLIKKKIPVEKIITMDGVYPYFKNIRFYKRDNIKKVCFWPPINKYDNDIQKKISWFIPDKAEVTVWCEEGMESVFNKNVCIGSQKSVEKEFNEADAIYIWNITNGSNIIDNYLDKMYVVDPNFWYYTESINYSALYYNSFSELEKNRLLNESRALFHNLKIDNKFKRTNIFCSGPSIEEIYNADLGEALNIITNSMVKDKDLLEKIRPKILIYADVNFYLSPNEYCKKFYEDVLEAVKKYDMYVVVSDYGKPLILHHYPDLKHKVIGIPFNSNTFVFPDREHFCIKNTGNILTMLLLPIASALCDEIGIAGCTGRNPDETYYWKHNPNTQYLDLMQSVFDMFPSVFRDQKYDNYYDLHCKTVKEIIDYGERLGKKYINMTTSYIPALRNRSVEGLL